MKDTQISREQFGALLWAGALAPVVELLPTITLPVAGRGAWLSPLVAVAVLFPFFYKMDKLGGSVLTAREKLGKIFGTAFLIVYLGWLELLLTLRLGLCARRMLVSGERDGSIWFFLLTLVILCLWMGRGNPVAFARAGQIFLTVLVLVGVVVLLLSLPKTRIDWLLPLWKEDVPAVLGSGVPAAGVLFWSLLPMLCLRPAMEKGGKHLLWWGVGGCIALCAMQAILIGNLGAGLSGRTQNAFFALTKSVGVEGAFQRLESVVAALWLLADLTLAVTILLAVRAICEELIPEFSPNLVVGGALGIGLWGAWCWCFRGESMELWNRGWVPAGNLALGLGGTTLLYIGSTIGQKIKGISIFRGRSGQKNGTSWGLKKDEKSRKKVLTNEKGSDNISKRSTVRHKSQAE